MLMSYGGQMRTGAAEALWKLANERPISETDTANMFFSDFYEQRGPTARTHERYFGRAEPSTGRRASTASRVLHSTDDESDAHGNDSTHGGASQPGTGSQVHMRYCLGMLPHS